MTTPLALLLGALLTLPMGQDAQTDAPAPGPPAGEGDAAASSTAPGDTQTAPTAKGGASPAASAPAAEAPAGPHAVLDGLLARHVRLGRVDYGGLLTERPALRAYLHSLSPPPPAGTSRDALMALWINAYNAATLELILDHHGRIASIKDIPSSQRWKARRWDLGGRRVSLDDIEHEILRPLGEPRIHFALVCASVSCPDLRSEAYTEARLDDQLDDAARRFLADTGKGLRTVTGRGFFGGATYELQLSLLFDWFEQDFGGSDERVIAFALRHAPAPAAAFIREHRQDLDLDHLDYDWSLNDDPNRRSTGTGSRSGTGSGGGGGEDPAPASR